MAARYPYGEFYASLKRGDVVFVNGNVDRYYQHLKGRKYVVASKRYGLVNLKIDIDSRYSAFGLPPESLTLDNVSLEDML